MKIPCGVRYREKYLSMILSPYFSDFKEINVLHAEAGYEFMKMKGWEVRVVCLKLDATNLLGETLKGLVPNESSKVTDRS